MTINWSMSDISKGARTIEEIIKDSKLPGTRNKHFNCVRSPMLPIPITDVVMDPLPMYLHISDQLIRQLVKDLHTQDNVKKNQKNVDKVQVQEYNKV